MDDMENTQTQEPTVDGLVVPAPEPAPADAAVATVSPAQPNLAEILTNTEHEFGGLFVEIQGYFRQLLERAGVLIPK